MLAPRPRRSACSACRASPPTGLSRSAGPQPGETVFVSAAAGAVGSVAARWRRSSAAGSDRQRRLAGEGRVAARARLRRLRSTTGGRPCGEALARGLRPDGIDVYFDNVGGDHLEAAIGASSTTAASSPAARSPATTTPSPAAASEPASGRRSALIQGFIISDHWDRLPEFLADGAGMGTRRPAALPGDRRRRDRERAAAFLGSSG